MFALTMFGCFLSLGGLFAVAETVDRARTHAQQVKMDKIHEKIAKIDAMLEDWVIKLTIKKKFGRNLPMT